MFHVQLSTTGDVEGTKTLITTGHVEGTKIVFVLLRKLACAIKIYDEYRHRVL